MPSPASKIADLFDRTCGIRRKLVHCCNPKPAGNYFCRDQCKLYTSRAGRHQGEDAQKDPVSGILLVNWCGVPTLHHFID